jgi:hypothetical protein
MLYVYLPVGVPRTPSLLGGLNLNPYSFLLFLLLCSSLTITQRPSTSGPTKPISSSLQRVPGLRRANLPYLSQTSCVDNKRLKNGLIKTSFASHLIL